jgi:hypothetical protein
MLVRFLKAAEHLFIYPLFNYMDDIQSGLAPYLASMFFILIAVFFAAIFECVGVKNNHRFFGRVLQVVGRCLIVLSGVFITWFSLYLGSIPVDKWPIDLNFHEYLFMEICYGIILLVFVTLFLFVFFLGVLSIFGIIINEGIKKEIYKKAYYMMKIIVVLGLASWAIVATHSTIYYMEIQGIFIKPLIVMSIIAVVILLVLPGKIEPGRKTYGKISKKTKSISSKHKK